MSWRNNSMITIDVNHWFDFSIPWMLFLKNTFFINFEPTNCIFLLLNFIEFSIYFNHSMELFYFFIKKKLVVHYVIIFIKSLIVNHFFLIQFDLFSLSLNYFLLILEELVIDLLRMITYYCLVPFLLFILL